MRGRNRYGRRRHWRKRITGNEWWKLQDDLRRGEDERSAEQGNRQDRDDQRPGRAHRAANHLRAQVRQPRALRAPAGPLVEGGHQDALIEVRRGMRHVQRAEEAQDAGAAADLDGAGGTPLDVERQARGVGRVQLIEQERVDQRSGARAIEGVADLWVRHTTYMTSTRQKVARACHRRHAPIDDLAARRARGGPVSGGPVAPRRR